MKLTQKALDEIRSNKTLLARLQLVLNKSAFTIFRYVKDNSDDLTKAAALAVIREETGLTDSEILVGEDQKVRA